ncbi:MAG: TetR/AcrR family transcriptional regulator [Pseudomonadota bacterium]
MSAQTPISAPTPAKPASHTDAQADPSVAPAAAEAAAALGTAAANGTTAKSGRKGFDPKVRDKVITAARRAMEKGGIDSVKARYIANEAGISVGSIYNLFDDLDELVRIVNGETYDRLLASEQAALDGARAAGAAPIDQMLALARAYLEFVVEHQGIWQSTLAFNRSRKAAPPAWYAAKEEALFDVIEDAISVFPGTHDPQVRATATRALWASVHGIVTMAVADGFLMQPVDEVGRQIEIVVKAMGLAMANADFGARS